MIASLYVYLPNILFVSWHTQLPWLPSTGTKIIKLYKTRKRELIKGQFTQYVHYRDKRVWYKCLPL